MRCRTCPLLAQAAARGPATFLGKHAGNRVSRQDRLHFAFAEPQNLPFSLRQKAIGS